MIDISHESWTDDIGIVQDRRDYGKTVLRLNPVSIEKFIELAKPEGAITMYGSTIYSSFRDHKGVQSDEPLEKVRQEFARAKLAQLGFATLPAPWEALDGKPWMYRADYIFPITEVESQMTALIEKLSGQKTGLAFIGHAGCCGIGNNEGQEYRKRLKERFGKHKLGYLVRPELEKGNPIYRCDRYEEWPEEK